MQPGLTPPATPQGHREMSERRECWIDSGCVDVRDVELSLPQGIIRCYACGGNGKYKQRYCDAGFLTGPCDSCRASGFMYEATCEGVPASVTNQIAVSNALECRPIFAHGLEWKRPVSDDRMMAKE